jgi:hypothetical protein
VTVGDQQRNEMLSDGASSACNEDAHECHSEKIERTTGVDGTRVCGKCSGEMMRAGRNFKRRAIRSPAPIDGGTWLQAGQLNDSCQDTPKRSLTHANS